MFEELRLAIAATVVVGMILLGFAYLYSQHKKKIEDTTAEFQDSILAIHENVQDLHLNVQDLHLITFYGDEEEKKTKEEEEEKKKSPPKRLMCVNIYIYLYIFSYLV